MSSLDCPFPLVTVPLEQAETELLRLRQQGKAEGFTPVILGDDNSLAILSETFRTAPGELEGAFDVEAWMREKFDAELGEVEIEPAIEEAEPMMSLDIVYVPEGQAAPPVYIAMIPTEQSWKLPLYVGMGSWNECPSPKEHAALARYWQKHYGAEIAVITSETFEFTVERPPATDEEAWELAHQQGAYCLDLIGQVFGSLGELAGALRKSTRWYFWWD